MRACQVVAHVELNCPVRESGGYRCERRDPHGPDDRHAISAHTIAHALAGNGYSCAAIDGMNR